MPTNPKRILKWLGIGTTIFIILWLGTIGFIKYMQYTALPWETPDTLSNVNDTIEVWNIQWACDCAEWGIVGEKVPEDSLLEDYSIFIEAAPGTERYENAVLPQGCWAKNLKLIGQFYTDKGISRDYEIMFEKPEAARVFRYNSYAVADYECFDSNAVSSTR